MSGDWENAWQSWLSRFNTHHVPAGHTGGGQFAPSSGSSNASTSKGAKGGRKAAPKAAAAPAKGAAHGNAARKAQLRAKANADRAQAHKLEALLKVLIAQHAVGKRAAAKAAKQAASAKAAAGKHHATATQKAHAKTAHHKAQNAHAHHGQLQQRINSLRTQISRLLDQAKQLDAQASRL